MKKLIHQTPNYNFYLNLELKIVERYSIDDDDERVGFSMLSEKYIFLSDDPTYNKRSEFMGKETMEGYKQSFIKLEKLMVLI
jgi:hypothetical protein